MKTKSMIFTLVFVKYESIQDGNFKAFRTEKKLNNSKSKYLNPLVQEIFIEHLIYMSSTPQVEI